MDENERENRAWEAYGAAMVRLENGTGSAREAETCRAAAHALAWARVDRIVAKLEAAQ